MHFIDIHTHHPPTSHPEDMSIISIDIRKPFTPCSLWYSVGVHPWYIDYNDPATTTSLFEKVRTYAQLQEVVAIGETGLDKLTAKSANDYQLQKALFASHAHLAEEVAKPLIIHCVRAWDDILHIRQSTKPTIPWIIHGFKGKEPLARQLLDAGLYLSFGLHYDKASLNVAWSRHHLLAETDDSQANIRDIYRQIANDLHISEQLLKKNYYLCKILTKNER